ncbi:MAG: sugar phosphate nucleotidyltransferase, partial [Solirubrobacterales bacterium]
MSRVGAEASCVVVLAGGKGTRMQSRITKVRHPVAGLPMLVYPVLAAQQAGAKNVVVVTSPDDDFADILPTGTTTATQVEALGTGDAVKAAETATADADRVIVLSGDTPLIDSELIAELAEAQSESGAAMVIATARLADPTGYGRIVRDAHGHVEHVAETKVAGDASTAELAIDEVNAGIYVFDRGKLFAALAEIKSDNAQGEYYLPDVLAMAVDEGHRVGATIADDANDTMGINDRAQ